MNLFMKSLLTATAVIVVSAVLFLLAQLVIPSNFFAGATALTVLMLGVGGMTKLSKSSLTFFSPGFVHYTTFLAALTTFLAAMIFTNEVASLQENPMWVSGLYFGATFLLANIFCWLGYKDFSEQQELAEQAVKERQERELDEDAISLLRQLLDHPQALGNLTPYLEAVDRLQRRHGSDETKVLVGLAKKTIMNQPTEVSTNW